VSQSTLLEGLEYDETTAKKQRDLNKQWKEIMSTEVDDNDLLKAPNQLMQKRSLDDGLILLIPSMMNMIWDAIRNDKHNVIPIWGEMGLGKTSLALWVLYRVYGDWELVKKNVVFTFHEMMALLKMAVKLRARLALILWDDIAVYFHRASIQYMHPEVKDFFSKYNFIRPYLANMAITTPNIEFIPRQLLDFATADVYVTRRGYGDFDRSRILRKYQGNTRTFRKNYDGRDVEWEKLPPDIQKWYDDERHAHATEAFDHPEDIFMYSMPTPDDE